MYQRFRHYTIVSLLTFTVTIPMVAGNANHVVNFQSHLIAASTRRVLKASLLVVGRLPPVIEDVIQGVKVTGGVGV